MRDEVVMVSVVIATKNSEWVIVPTLESIQNQTLRDGVAIEVIVVDAGSSDRTLQIADMFGARTIHNINGDPVSAKLLGLSHANGRYVMFLDHDERLISSTTVGRVIDAFARYPATTICMLSGYDPPSIGSAPNLFGSEFGDAYSRFIFGNSAMADVRLDDLRQSLPRHIDNGSVTYFCTRPVERPVVLECCAIGTTCELGFLRTLVSKHGSSALISPLKHMSGEYIALVHDSAVKHVSASSWSTIRTKTKWKISNSVDRNSALRPESGGLGHFISHNQLMVRRLRYVLAALLVFPVLTSYAILAVQRRRPQLLWAVHLHYFVLWEAARQVVNTRLRGRRYGRDYAGGIQHDSNNFSSFDR